MQFSRLRLVIELV